MTSIDLNADLGESPERLADGSDAALLALVTSANIACGGHAGDAASMAATIAGALARGVAIGAHPSFPDPPNFGRLDMDLPAAELARNLEDQIRALDLAARTLGARLSHVKPHGALYHAAGRRPAVATAIGRAAAAVDPAVVLVGQAGSPALAVWRAMGFRVAAEGFCDRRYEADGSLRARDKPGAVLDDPSEAAAQAVRLAKGLGAVAEDGSVVPVAATTLCVHGDSPGAVPTAQAVRRALAAAGVSVRGWTRPTA